MAAKNKTTHDPVRRWTLIVLGLIVVLFLYSLIADRYTPYTSQGIVQAFVVRMAAEVAGRVIEVNVADNQRVKAGDVLFRVDPEPYEIALEQAKARLAAVGQTIGANTAGVTSAQERLAEAQAQRDNVLEQSNRVLVLVEKGVYAEARKDRAIKEMDVAEASVREAASEVERARQELGPQGNDNLPSISAPVKLVPSNDNPAIPRGARRGREGQTRPPPHHGLSPCRWRRYELAA